MFSIATPTEFQWVAIALVGTLSTARLGRLIVHDHWPPAEWLRRTWDRIIPDRTDKPTWNLLLHCHFCVTVWLGYGIILWGHFTDWNTIWWLINGGLAVAYGAAYVVTYDGDDG